MLLTQCSGDSFSRIFYSAVNVAYRLGAFGFMASDALTAEGQHANAALLDMRMAFEWVQKNIQQYVVRSISNSYLTWS